MSPTAPATEQRPVTTALVPRVGDAPVAAPVQASLDDVLDPVHGSSADSALLSTTFVVVDLETTGGSPTTDAITEIGAVKVRGGEVLGELQTLVRPGQPIPPFVAVLTGITDRMVADAPGIDAVLPAFLEFADGCVLVAHNAPFDVGFLRAACQAQDRPWPGFRVLDTARLARTVLTRDEAPNCRLATLATVLHASTVPEHRALADARATVDVFHALLARLGNQGVHTLGAVQAWQSKVSPQQQRKRYLAESLPDEPGVYVFADARGEALYVGKSRNVRARVRTYFTAAETRPRMAEMVGLAESVTPIVCSTGLEAEVRELRLIAALKPRYNRRSRHPERAVWLKLTVEPFPRLSIVGRVRDDGATYLGPFASRRGAEAAMTAVHEAVPIRQCTDRLSTRARSSACALAEMGRCGAPCTGHESVDQYRTHTEAVREAFVASPRRLVDRLLDRIRRLADGQRYEEAAVHRDRMATFVRAAARTQRLAALAAVSELVAARRGDGGGWELHVVRHGRLAAAGRVPPGEQPMPVVEALVATAEHVEPAPAPLPAATAEEAECVLRWMELPGTRLVSVSGTWQCPAGGASALLDAVVQPQRGRSVPRPGPWAGLG